jgi:hypothetical protein
MATARYIASATEQRRTRPAMLASLRVLSPAWIASAGGHEARMFVLDNLRGTRTGGRNGIVIDTGYTCPMAAGPGHRHQTR